MVDGPHGPHLPYTHLENTAPTATFSLVVAHTPGRGWIGARNTLPWSPNAADMGRFRRLTTTTHRPGMKNAVVMGRKTWESLHNRALPGRLNIVVTSQASVDGVDGVDVLKSTSLSDALRVCAALAFVDRVFVIGGGDLFRAALSSPCVEGVEYVFSSVITAGVDAGVDDNDDASSGDAETPPGMVSVDFRAWTQPEGRFELLWSCTDDASVGFYTYGAKGRRVLTCPSATPDRCIGYPHPHEEAQYLCLVDSILRFGVPSPDRTGTGTLSQFGAQLRFTLRDGVLPLLTTKQTFFRGVMEELLTLFVPGCTDAGALTAKGVHIWDANVAANGGNPDMGPMYGFQWRHFGAEYEGCGKDYAGKGVDQLAWVLREIKANPTSRRLVVSAWNPVDVPAMVLPPCHVMFQFYVRNGELSCHMTQRSADVGLGLPFNIASYALLTHLVAYVSDLTPGELVISLGDAHVYQNHEGALLEQYCRTPKPFCHLVIAKDTPKDLFAISPDALSVTGYSHQGKLPMPLSA
jgi:dihydrofolate reductase/thymidylate synthase